jgi:sugar phosphate permease
MEKEHNSHAEYAGKDSSDENAAEVTPQEGRQILHRIDRRLVLICGLMYCVSLMDRTNLSVAAVAGMVKDLKLKGNYHYNIIALVFFPTYIVFQIPSTVVVRKIGPRIHLSAITLFWGAVMIGMGFVKTWDVMAGLRVILGVFEAGFFPSAVYLLSTWFTRYEVQKRFAVFYLLGSVASAFAGILAYGISHLDGRANLGGWRWIFIIEGIITCFLAVLGYVFLVGFPDDENAHKHRSWLNQRELKFVIDRIQADRGDAHTEPFDLWKYLGAGVDLKIWVFSLLFFSTTTITYALAYFLPVILRSGMGFTVGQSQCLIAPPYALAGIVMFLTAWVGDKYHMRGPIIVFNMLLCIVGLAIMGWAARSGVRYFGVFLVTAGANSNIPAVLAFQANNVRGQWKRAFSSATLVGMGGVGGIAGSLVFREKDAPHYYNGLWACIACALLSIILVALLTIKFKANNKKADEGNLVIEGSEDFRYTT